MVNRNSKNNEIKCGVGVLASYIMSTRRLDETEFGIRNAEFRAGLGEGNTENQTFCTCLHKEGLELLGESRTITLMEFIQNMGYIREELASDPEE
jgi:hypothetical protein